MPSSPLRKRVVEEQDDMSETYDLDVTWEIVSQKQLNLPLIRSQRLINNQKKRLVTVVEMLPTVMDTEIFELKYVIQSTPLSRNNLLSCNVVLLKDPSFFTPLLFRSIIHV